MKSKTKDFNKCICFIFKMCTHRVMKSLCCVIICAPVNEAVLKPTSETKNKLKSKNHVTMKTLWWLQLLDYKEKQSELPLWDDKHDTSSTVLVLGWHLKNIWLFLSAFKIPEKQSHIKIEKSVAAPENIKVLLTEQNLLKTQSRKDWIERKIHQYQPSCDTTQAREQSAKEVRGWISPAEPQKLPSSEP